MSGVTRRVVLLVFITVSVLLPTLSRRGHAQRAAPGTWYTVTIPEYDRRLARVEARIELTDTLLVMYPKGAEHLPQGWATYVRGLTATDDAGRAVRLRARGPGRWSVASPRPRALRLRYEILLHHDAGFWPFGAKSAAYVKDDGVFVTGKALFITQHTLPPARVRFALPERWRIATPWTEVAGEAATFAVPNSMELLDVGMLLGRHNQRRLLIGSTTVILATGQSLAGAAEPLNRALSRFLLAADTLFGGTPRGTFVVIANTGDTDGGSAFIRSFDVVFTEPPTLERPGEWTHVLAHEVLHHWLGYAMATGSVEQEFWLMEGATDYLANLIEFRTGMLSADGFFERIAGHWDRYRAVAGTTSLAAAGADKAGNYDLVYSGGLLAAFVMDAQLRERTTGRFGFDSIARRLYAEFGRTGRPVARDAVQRVARQATGVDLDPFFARHVAGTALLPVAEALTTLGYSLDRVTEGDSTRSVIRVRDDQTPAQRTLVRELLGHRIR